MHRLFTQCLFESEASGTLRIGKPLRSLFTQPRDTCRKATVKSLIGIIESLYGGMQLLYRRKVARIT